MTVSRIDTSKDGRLTDKAVYGRQIKLTCKNHPNKFWSTKNISPIGCRTIFWDLFHDSEGPECDCGLSDLQVKD